jgi:hypothetical protein
MDRAELMKLSPEEAFNAISWESIEYLFEPANAFQLLLRLDYNGTIKVLRQKLDVINKLEKGREMELWNEAKGYIAIEDYYRLLKEEKYKQEKRETMKFTITMKDPDGVYDSMKDAGYDLDDLPPEIDDVIKKFFEFKEVVTIEFDIETGEATVVPI